MTSHLHAETSQERHSTHKSEFSFCSPARDDQPTTAPKNISLQESRKVDYMRNRTELFTENRKENFSVINKSNSNDFIQQLANEHRIEVQKLLLEISRLHDMLDNQERIHKHSVQKLKEESEQVALLRISHLRQSQVSQLEIVDVQLRKTREALDEKNQQFEELEKRTLRKIEGLTQENQTLKNDLRQAIEAKNEEVYSLKGTFSKQSQQIIKKKEQELNEMRQITEKQMKKIQKRLILKEESLEQLKKDYEEVQNKKSDLEQKIEECRITMEDKMSKIIDSQRQKQLELVANLKEFYDSQNEQTEEGIKIQRDLFLQEIQSLIKIIQLKDGQAQRNMIFRETQRLQFNLLTESIENQNAELKRKIGWLKKKQLEEVELLKVKMGVLHQNDIQELLKIYEAKIQNLSRELKNLGKQYERMEQSFIDQKEKHYTTKKKYDHTVSRFNEEVLLLKTGMNDMEKDLKEKVENEKSMMMLTSRSLIKEAEIKNTNVKFYEEELRKLRQLLQIQAQEVEDSERNVEEKIKMAEEELTRLSNKILDIKGESEEAEKKFRAIIQEKDEEIKRLNQVLNTPVSINNQNNENEGIRKLEEQIAEKQDKLKTYKLKSEELESDVRLYRAEIQRLNMENQINTEDAKKHYKATSDKNLHEMKGFYDRRLKELEDDKSELCKINSNQTEQITDLVKKYKKAEESMKELVKQSKKRGDLQARIINLGMDNNLVKNMAQLFHK